MGEKAHIECMLLYYYFIIYLGQKVLPESNKMLSIPMHEALEKLPCKILLHIPTYKIDPLPCIHGELRDPLVCQMPNG